MADVINAAPLPGAAAWRLPSLGKGLVLVGFAALALPTLLRLGQQSWSTEAGAHGPIVLVTAIWLLWRESDTLKVGLRQTFWPGGVMLFVALPFYVAGRVTNILMVESLSLYLVMLTLLFLDYGIIVLLRLWFPLGYLLFLVTPPENWIFSATQPFKMALGKAAVSLLSHCGLMVGSAGSMIQIDGYQLLVAAACSGLNSLIGISAISLFYVYLRHGSEPRYAIVLLLLLLPIALLTNLLRIMGLILATHWFGPGVVEGIIHEAAGIGTFAVALILLLGIDAMLFPLFNRLGLARG